MFAEIERRRIGERTREAMAKLPDETRDRMRLGGRPRSIPAEVEARVGDLRAEGLTFAAIAARLNDERVPTTTGGPWWPGTLRRLALRSAQAPT